jgi:hypothetical protein
MLIYYIIYKIIKSLLSQDSMGPIQLCCFLASVGNLLAIVSSTMHLADFFFSVEYIATNSIFLWDNALILSK